MTYTSPETTEPTAEHQLGESKPFDVDQATLGAISYGHPGNGLTLDVPMNGRDTLWQADPTADRHEYAFLGVPPMPIEDKLLRGLVFNGTSESFSLSEVWNLKMLTQNIEEIAAKLEKISGMESGVVSLKAVANEIILRRAQLKATTVERINSYIKDSKSPYWIVVDTQSIDSEDQPSANYAHSHKLAELAQIELTEDGTVRTVLRQADDSLGYVTGSKYLYL